MTKQRLCVKSHLDFHTYDGAWFRKEARDRKQDIGKASDWRTRTVTEHSHFVQCHLIL